MGLKSILLKLVWIISTFTVIYLSYLAGWKVVLALCAGVFIGACVVLYWEYSRNSWLSAILMDVMHDKEDKEEE